MIALYDRFVDDLPYHAHAPWPRIEHNGNWDWVESTRYVELWLVTSVGSHYTDWAWSMWDSCDSFHCRVSFRKARSVSLFLLRFG